MPGPRLQAALEIFTVLGLLLYAGPVSVLCVVAGFLILVSAAGGAEERAPASSETRPQEEAQNISIVSADVPDAPISSQTTALEKVFHCVYTQFFSPWYEAPELMKDQPLYKSLHAELMAAVDAIGRKTAHVTRKEVLVGLIENLTIHLHGCAEKKHTLKMFRTELEEVEFFRRYTKELIKYLLPSSLADSNLAEMFLTEILAVKVFKPTVNMLADPDFLNQILISRINGQAAKPLSNMDCFPAAGDAPVPTPLACSNTEDDTNTRNDEDETTVPKRKKKWIKKIFQKLKSKMTSVSSRSLEADSAEVDEVDGGSEDEGSTNDDDVFLEADGPPSSEEISDLDVASNMCTSLSQMLCEDWNRHHWKATVSGECAHHIQRGLDTGMQIFTIHVEDEEKSTDIQWNINRTVSTFLNIQGILSKDFPDLKDFQLEEQDGIEIESILNSFLDRLVSIIQICQNSEALFFLLPIELLPENEVVSEESSDELEADGIASDQLLDSVDDDLITSRSLPERKRRIGRRTRTTGLFQQKPRKQSPKISYKGEAQGDALETAFNHLLVEILDSYLSTLLKCSGRQKYLLNNVHDMFNKMQWESSIDNLREILWPNGRPAPPIPIPTDKEKECTTSKARELLINKCPCAIIKSYWKSKAIYIFNIFQDGNQNKILICRWLLFVLDKVIPREERSWDVDDILTFT